MPRTIVLGGGISGLSAAHFLLRDAPELEVLLIEGAPRLGGTLGSERLEGFVLERGPNGFLDNVPDTLELALDLGLSERLIQASPAARRRYLLKGRKLLGLPSSPLGLLRSPLLSLGGRLRVLGEPLVRRPPDGEESVASFGRRRLGEEATRTLLDPLVTGIHAGDVERLSLPAAFPRLREMESRHGSLCGALLAARRERRRLEASGGAAPASALAAGQAPAGGRPDPGEGAPPRSALESALHSFPDGLEELVGALERRLGERVRRGWAAVQVVRDGKRFAVVGPGGARESGDALVLALPAYRAATLLQQSAPELSLALEAIPYSPIGVVCLGFPRQAVEHPLDGYGFLVPRDQGLRLLGSIWTSSLYPQHAPEGRVSLRCMVGGARDPDAIDHADDTLLAMVLEELRPILGLRGEPSLERVYRYTKGIPQYNLGHLARVEAVERQLWSFPGLFLAGNAYRGVGINDCVREARRKARAVLAHLRR